MGILQYGLGCGVYGDVVSQMGLGVVAVGEDDFACCTLAKALSVGHIQMEKSTTRKIKARSSAQR